MRDKIKSWMLPISIIGGILFEQWIGALKPIVPYLIFGSLVISFCKVSPREIRVKSYHLWMLTVQIIGAWAVYLLILPYNTLIAQGAFLCVLTPTASAAPVFTSMIGGNVTVLLTYSLLCNCAFSVLAPIFLNIVVPNNNLDIVASTLTIGEQIFPMIMVPLIIALLLRYRVPKLHRIIINNQSISFYMWSVAIFITIGNTVEFLINSDNNNLNEIIGLATASLVVCLAQFSIGKRIGLKSNNSIATGQGLGQKNTILAIWVALTFMNPLCSIAPASYIAWQNILNTYQLFKHRKKIKSTIE